MQMQSQGLQGINQSNFAKFEELRHQRYNLDKNFNFKLGKKRPMTTRKDLAIPSKYINKSMVGMLN